MAPHQLVCLFVPLLFVGIAVVFVIANRRMMAQYGAYARKFGLSVDAPKSLGLHRYPSAFGHCEGREIRVRSGGRISLVTGQPRPQVTTQLFVSGRPALTFRLERRSGARPGLDDEAFQSVFQIRDASSERVLASLDETTRRVLLEQANGLIVATPEGLSFFNRQQMITGEEARLKFEALTESFLRWVPKLERA